VFYLLAFIAIAVLTYGVYQRFSRYAEGTTIRSLGSMTSETES